ncbi:2-dehydro-3-deoxy-phosphogluconate aldolase [Citrobacter sp. RHB20-C16]|uniref:2-dehydro-3-deoxy-phosphogluconate aldolase n=1 Tax=Citrobacter TaxID=544 RepID=UPI0005C7387B|nr:MULTISPECIES: 2-dehydro-3-deoxy-phosphogluconate aldolase [Citrobacter]MBJ8737727.1 2-dehydro-3-deoxy-phosphogluconate aldolase [Citrobacter amalonaticus]MBJ9075895.1 2-dehydro-3-deoxy-phosphogluconate aldolase [Citrobacter amalonaticus]QMK76349.1 2-dehydro-3-deoxy-phosphogluconate aldolase [Citrobacter sp. RHB20-C16]QMK80960.1 2-dehydro-3-deoxy-phosphogluconate aldolase [Citrobacter sp. RHB20-C15]QPB32431.1 2-dehydro-3-deoxy-phosphogluconate aldolase [Citrobacter amalonaticus]
MQQINFYRQRVAINVLAKDIANAREIYDAAEGHAVIGILSAQFSSVDEGVQEVKRWMADVPSISVGLGAGDPAQYYKAAMIAAKVHPAHVNQTFTGSGFAAGALAATGGEQTHINALISPTGTPGDVLISTGVSSSQGTPARVSCDAAVRMMQDMGAHAAKFFPMGGEKSLPELYVLASSAARNGMTLIEPTGGIDLDNFGVILQTCLEAGVPRVMPHVYSSIIDPQTGNTRPEDIVRLMDIIKALV